MVRLGSAMSEPSSPFKSGDLVEYIGPKLDDPYEPQPGERGTLMAFDHLTIERVVSGERITSVHAEMWLRLVGATDTPPSG